MKEWTNKRKMYEKKEKTKDKKKKKEETNESVIAHKWDFIVDMNEKPEVDCKTLNVKSCIKTQKLKQVLCSGSEILNATTTQKWKTLIRSGNRKKQKQNKTKQKNKKKEQNSKALI